MMASLFKDYWVRPALGPEQNNADGKMALQQMVDQGTIYVIMVQMIRPRAVVLVWEKR